MTEEKKGEGRRGGRGIEKRGKNGRQSERDRMSLEEKS